MNKKRKIQKYRLIFDIILFLILVGIDQITKYFAVLKLREQKPFVLINGVFEFHYLENRGAAFGMLQNGKIFFVFAACLMYIAIIYILSKTPEKPAYMKWHILLTCIAAGGMGNMIDRIRLDYVVDFLYFSWIDFPIFNVADIYVTVSTIVLIFVILFFTGENELSFLALNLQKKSYK